MKCKDCIYFSGTTCQGHAEYWGTCNLLEQLRRYIETNKKDIYVKTDYSTTCVDETECKIIKKFNWEIIKL